MNAKPCSTSFARVAALAVFAPLAAWATETPAAQSNNNPVTHVLFTGTDIQVQHQGELHRVRGVADRAFVINVDGRNVNIPMGGPNPEKIKVSQAHLISDRVASLTQFKYERAYSPARDPQSKFAKGQLSTQAMEELARFSENATRNVPLKLERTIVEDGKPVKRIVDNPGVAEAGMRVEHTNQDAGRAIEVHQSNRSADSMEEPFDAIDVQFYVSAAKPIRDPYVVVNAKFHERDDEKHVSNWLFATEIDPIDDIPRKISIREGGFPPGFEVDELHVHLYEKGVEIATDLSENRAPLTRDEAHEYLLIEHLAAHKQASSPAQISLVHLPDDWLAHRHEAAFQKTYFVKVDHAGRAAGAFEDENFTTEVSDSKCTDILNQLRFLPALEKGQPVDGVVRVKPSSLGR